MLFRSGKAKKFYFLAMYVAAACATLVKGPIGVVLPAMVIGPYLLLTRRWSILREANPALGLGIFLLIAAPWYLAAELRNPGYLRYFLFEENFLRYVTPHFNRGQPWYYYVEVLAVGFFPWTALIYAPFTKPAELLRLQSRRARFLHKARPLLLNLPLTSLDRKSVV